MLWKFDYYYYYLHKGGYVLISISLFFSVARITHENYSADFNKVRG